MALLNKFTPIFYAIYRFIVLMTNFPLTMSDDMLCNTLQFWTLLLHFALESFNVLLNPLPVDF